MNLTLQHYIVIYMLMRPEYKSNLIEINTYLYALIILWHNHAFIIHTASEVLSTASKYIDWNVVTLEKDLSFDTLKIIPLLEIVYP